MSNDASYGPSNPDSQEYLTPEERLRMKRTLMFPEEFPKDFTDWLVDFMRINGQLNQRQIEGLSQLAVHPADEVLDQDNLRIDLGLDSWGSPTHPGPALVGLANGLYIVQAGAAMEASGFDYVFMSLEINGTMLGSNDSFPTNAIWQGGSNDGGFSSVSKTFHVSLTQNNNNTILAKYRHHGNSGFASYARERWMVAIKYGEVQGG